MTLTALSNIHLIQFKDPVSQTELLKQMANIAIEKKWAKDGFVDALLAREESYPTGLHTAGIEVAFPHADAEWTLLPGLIVAIVDKPVSFQPMGGQGEAVLARIIFLLIIPDADSHITFLQMLARFIENEGLLNELFHKRDINSLISFFSEDNT